MISRLIVRTVLFTVSALLAWAGYLTWSHQFVSTGDTNGDALKAALALKVVSLLIEGGVLLAALSLLAETFQSFGVINTNKRGWKNTFFGYNAYEEGDNVRTCELFALRSVLFAFTGVITVACVCVLWEAVKFLLNPHTVVVNWNVVFSFVAIIFSGLLVGGILISGHELLYKKVAGKSLVIRVAAVGAYWVASFSILYGVWAVTIFHDKELAAMPVWLAFLYTSGLMFLTLFVLAATFGLGLGLFKLAGTAIIRLSARFPAFQKVYNTICPVQTIHFVE